jgi:acylphosphatase
MFAARVKRLEERRARARVAEKAEQAERQAKLKRKLARLDIEFRRATHSIAAEEKTSFFFLCDLCLSERATIYEKDFRRGSAAEPSAGFLNICASIDPRCTEAFRKWLRYARMRSINKHKLELREQEVRLSKELHEQQRNLELEQRCLGNESLASPLKVTGVPRVYPDGTPASSVQVAPSKAPIVPAGSRKSSSTANCCRIM